MNFSDRRYLLQGPLFTIILMFYNYFILTSLFGFLDLNVSFNTTLLLIFIIAFVSLVPMTIERHHSHIITQILHEISQLWLWASFMYFFEIVILYIAGFFIRIPIEVMYAIVLLIIPILGLIGYYIAHHTYVQERDIKLRRIGYNLRDVSIIHVSDLHIGSIRRNSLLKTMVRDINRIVDDNPDRDYITVISGDISDGSAPVMEDTFKQLEKISIPVIFTPGNHDYYQSIDKVKKSLLNANVIVLDNDNLIFDDLALNIIGLSYSFSHEVAEYHLPIDVNYNNVLIYHAPFLWEESSSLGIELELSGHTHGGQFYPVIFLDKYIFKYLRGLFTREVYVELFDETITSYLSVTDGIGTFAPPIRLGTKSEIVVLNIKR